MVGIRLFPIGMFFFLGAKTLVLGRVDLERLLRCKGTQKYSPKWWLKMVMFHHGRIHKKLTLNKSNIAAEKMLGFQKERRLVFQTNQSSGTMLVSGKGIDF